MKRPLPPSKEVSGEHVAVERRGSRVAIIFQCRDEYHAMELFDEFNLDIERGHIGVTFGVKP
jgi:hypothetical protein